MLKARHTDDATQEVGIDEAGRGCLWGPLVAAAVIWPEESTWTEDIRLISSQIKDSKKITPKRRKVLEAAIKQYAIGWSLGKVEATEIDSLGMTKSNRLVFERALSGLSLNSGPKRVLIDGLIHISPQTDMEQIVEPNGDGTYLSIAAASILAKEGRDAIVSELCTKDPSLDDKYFLLSSKGYGTLKHRQGIQKNGMDAGHRRLFLRKLLGIEHVTSADSPDHYHFIDD